MLRYKSGFFLHGEVSHHPTTRPGVWANGGNGEPNTNDACDPDKAEPHINPVCSRGNSWQHGLVRLIAPGQLLVGVGATHQPDAWPGQNWGIWPQNWALTPNSETSHLQNKSKAVCLRSPNQKPGGGGSTKPPPPNSESVGGGEGGAGME